MLNTGTFFGTALIAVILLSCPCTAPPEPAAPSPVEPIIAIPPNSTINGTPLNNTDSEWALITKANVEGACLSQAKKEAIKKGYSDAVVFGCSCSAMESASSKSYSCGVSALDGSHDVSIVCIKSSQTCLISADSVENTYSFDQIRQIAGQ